MSLLAVREARARVLADAKRLGVDHVPLHEAAGRVLAEDIAATRRGAHTLRDALASTSEKQPRPALKALPAC